MGKPSYFSSYIFPFTIKKCYNNPKERKKYCQMSITNPHDLIFKQTESHLENAKDYLRGTCPPELIKNLNLEKLKLEESSYTTEELSEYFSDLVYTCVYRGKTKIKITLLFEHKSFKPDYPMFKILQYMINIWETQLKGKQALTPIIPILFYHGKEKWEPRKLNEYFTGIDEYLKTFIPGFDIIFTNITKVSDEQVRNKLFDREANKILFLLMRHIFDPGYMLDHLQDFLEIGRKYFESKEGIGFLKSILIYLFTTNEFESKMIFNILNKISEKGEELAMTTAMQLKKEGKIEAAQKMLKKGYSIEEICDITGLTATEVKKLKKKQ